MTMDRFPWQVAKALEANGIVLNIGCNEDPGALGLLSNVFNCDISDHNPTTGAQYPVDYVFDCCLPWPFDNDSVDLAVLGDIVEHMFVDEFKDCLSECYRVARNVAITIPKDHRILEDPDYYAKISELPKGAVHVHVYDEQELRGLLNDAGFDVAEWLTVDYGFVPEGYFILARRRSNITTSGDVERRRTADTTPSGPDA